MRQTIIEWKKSSTQPSSPSTVPVSPGIYSKDAETFILSWRQNWNTNITVGKTRVTCVHEGCPEKFPPSTPLFSVWHGREGSRQPSYTDYQHGISSELDGGKSKWNRMCNGEPESCKVGFPQKSPQMTMPWILCSREIVEYLWYFNI